jgi:hypothetical protein
MRRSIIYPGLIVWFLLALTIGYGGNYDRAAPYGIAVTVWALVAILVLLYLFVPGFREWAGAEPVIVFVLFHLTRFVGIWFLVLYGEGRLPYEFGVLGGWGDIIAAVGAILVVLIWFVTKGRRAWWPLLVWNIFGLVDILFVVRAALRSGLGTPHLMLPLRVFPLNLLPMFVVPLIIATHLFIFVRLRRGTI